MEKTFSQTLCTRTSKHGEVNSTPKRNTANRETRRSENEQVKEGREGRDASGCQGRDASGCEGHEGPSRIAAVDHPRGTGGTRHGRRDQCGRDPGDPGRGKGE